MEIINNFCSIHCLVSFILGSGFMLVILALVAISKDKKSKNKVHFYVARDKDGDLWLYLGKPHREETGFYCLSRQTICLACTIERFGLKSKDYNYLKWEDEPVEVFLNLED